MRKTIDTLYISSIISLILGFWKMWVYSVGEYSSPTINAYVGGDAYNYIINANYAIAWFILAVGCAIVATLLRGQE